MEKAELITLYGTDDVNEIIKRKTENRQDKVFATRKPKRVEMTAAECKKLCEKVGLEYLDGYEGRIIEHVITDETVDRDGDIIRAKGVDYKTNYYPKNPTILFAHEGRNFPVGKSIKVWHDSTENNIKSQGIYFDDRMDRTGRSDTVFRMVAGGGMPACSVGFYPLKVNRPNGEEREAMGLGEYGVEFIKSELLEYSPCSVGSNPNALQNMLKALKTREEMQQALNTIIPKELIDDFIEAIRVEHKDFIATINIEPEDEEPPEGFKTILDFYDKTVEITEDEVLKPYPSEHACRLKDPSKYEKFRRSQRESDGKKYNIIFGKLKGENKWEEQAYRYPKDGWTTAQARKHCKDHNGISFEPASEAVVELNEKLCCGIDTLIEEIKLLSTNMKELNTTLEPLKDLRAGDSDDNSSGKPSDDKKNKDLYKCLEEEGNALQL